MLYFATDIANFFVLRALKDRRPLTPMQIGKLTFLAHGWNLGLKGEPLINEAVQAWKYGPVVPSIYFAFQEYGKDPVTQIHWLFDPTELPNIAKEDQDLLEKIYKEYGKYSGAQLSSLTHKKDTPWEQTVRRFNGQELPRLLPIENSIIRSYYQGKANVNS